MTRWKMFQPPMPWIYDLRGMDDLYNQVLLGCFFWDGSEWRLKGMVNEGSKLKLKTFCAGKRESIMAFFLKITAIRSVFTLKSVWPVFVGDFSRNFHTSDFYPDFLKSSRSWFRISLHVNPYSFGKNIHVGLTIFRTGGSIITSSWFNFMNLSCTSVTMAVPNLLYLHLSSPGAKMKSSYPSPPPKRKQRWQWKPNIWIWRCIFPIELEDFPTSC